MLARFLLSQSQFKTFFLDVLAKRNRGNASFLWFQCFKREGDELQKSNATMTVRVVFVTWLVMVASPGSVSIIKRRQ